MLSVMEALAAVLQHAETGPAEMISLNDALSRTLAEDLTVPHDSPPFDKALMDGFAVCVRGESAAVANSNSPNCTFSVVETITAGRIASIAIDEQRASRIMTGAPLPLGCNCVVPIELTQFDERQPECVSIPISSLRSEVHVLRKGAAAREGSSLLLSGTRLQPQHLAALAEFGISRIGVHRQPRVAIFVTGDELTPFDQPLEPGQIRNSNEPMLVAQVSASDAIAVAMGIARDHESELSACIQRGLQYDVLLISGGVSAGILDLVPAQLNRAGVRQIFHGVHMKPGKPLWFGKKDDGQRACLVFGLPGNPVSSLACFELFVRPALKKFSGRNDSGSSITAVLSDSIQVKGNRPVYQPVAVSTDVSRLSARPIPWSSSSDLRATAEANGMALLLPEHGLYAAGEVVEIWLWGDQRIS